MITEAESGLTSLQYAALQDARVDADYRLKAYQWLPEFTEDFYLGKSLYAFDMVAHDGTLFAVIDTKLYKLISGTWTAIAGFTRPASMIPGNPYSLISEGGNLYIFARTNTTILRNTYNGSTFTGWSTLVTESGVIIAYMAAVASDRIHYVTFDSSLYYCHFKVYDATVITDSNIYWPFIINGFDAVNFNGQDVIVIASGTPGAISAKYLNNVVVKYALQAGGLVSFTYKNGTWSDHYELDILDEIHDWRFRDIPRLSIIDDKLWLTSYSGDGTENYPFIMYRSFTTKDGIHWSHGEYFPANTDSRYGVVLASLSDEVYLMQARRISKAPRTRLFGETSIHTDTIEDITPYVMQIQVSRQDMQQIDVILNNESGWIDDSILSGNKLISLVLETGYHVNGERLLIQTGIFESDGITESEDLPEHSVELTGRDWLAWMETKYQAEQFKWWQPPLIGGDEYIDNTGTGYGGMAHSAVQSGSWLTIDNRIYLQDNELEGIVLSTFGIDIWNGHFQARINPSQASDDERLGLIFRGQDKDNHYRVEYKQSNDKLHLYRRIGGEDTLLWIAGSTMGWNDIDNHWVRVEFYYCQIKIYTSEGTADYPSTWTLQSTTLISGLKGDDPITQIGCVGYLGKGFSDLATWSPDPGAIPAPFMPPDPPPAPPTPFLPAGIGTMAAWTNTSKLLITNNFDNPASLGGPTWTTIDLSGTITGGSSDAIVDAFSPLYLGTGTEVNIWVVNSTNLYYITDIFGAHTITSKHTFAASISGRTLATERGFQNYICVSSYYGGGNGTKLLSSIDNSTFVETQVTANNINPSLPALMRSIHVSPHINGQVYITAFSAGGNGRLFRCNILSGSPTFTDITPAITGSETGIYGFWVPYGESSDDSVYYWSAEKGVSNPDSKKHTASGETTFYTGFPIIQFIRKAFSICPIDSNTAVFASFSHQLYLSRNAGSSFSQIDATAQYEQLDVAGDNPDVIYAWGNSNMKIFYITLSGTTPTVDSRKGNLSGTDNILCIFGGG